MTALREACLNGRLDVAKLLIEAGAHVNEKDEVSSGELFYGACSCILTGSSALVWGFVWSL